LKILKILILIASLIILEEKTAMAEVIEENYHFLIKVDFSEFKLIVSNANGTEIITFPVAIPKTTPKSIPIEGEIKHIERNPYWYPTEKTRADYLKNKKIILPRYLPPGHPKNAMGEVKFIINFKTSGINPVIRIHGTNDPSSIGKRITRGCIRLKNEDALYLADIIEGKKTKVIFEL